MKKYKDIQELYEAVSLGLIDEAKLEIVIDKDYITFFLGEYKEGKDNELYVGEGGKINEIDLYKILFPKAVVW